MGKTAFNPLSQWNGRVGGMVYKVVNGKQVIMPYKTRDTKGDQVSVAQLATRAKFALAGKFSKITPSEIMRGLNGSRVDRRSNFVKAITKAATVTVDGTQVVANIAPDKIIFSDGLVTMLNMGTPTLNNAGVLAASIANIPESVDAVLVIAVCSNASGEYDRVNYQVCPVDDEAHTATVSINTDAVQGTHVRVYYVPLTVTDQARSFLSTSEYDEHATDEYTLTMLLTSVEGAYEWGRSQYVTELTPANA